MLSHPSVDRRQRETDRRQHEEVIKNNYFRYGNMFGTDRRKLPDRRQPPQAKE